MRLTKPIVLMLTLVLILSAVTPVFAEDPRPDPGNGTSGIIPQNIGTAEATMIVNFSPRTGFAGGLGLLLRYHFLALDRWQPYVEGGAGFLGLALDLADQADGFAFQPQGGVGLLYAITPRTSVEFGTRFHHISNAFTQEPNGGIDTFQILFGATHRFE